MRLKTVGDMLKGGKLFLFLKLQVSFMNFYRLGFLASLADTSLLDALSRGPVDTERLEQLCQGDQSLLRAYEALLGLGMRLGIVKKKKAGYVPGSMAARLLVHEVNDPLKALLQETVRLHYRYIIDTPLKLSRGELWDGSGEHREFGDIIARSSRSLEPFIFEVIDRFFPSGPEPRLLEAGCGHGGYMIYAAGRYPGLTAVGLELDPAVADKARKDISQAGLDERISVQQTDIRDFAARELFDVITLYNNIYYFPVEQRAGLFSRLRKLLKPGGKLILTTGCMGGGIAFELVNLIHSSTKGWGRLPYVKEVPHQLAGAGFSSLKSLSLMPGDRYYAFIGHNPA